MIHESYYGDHDPMLRAMDDKALKSLHDSLEKKMPKPGRKYDPMANYAVSDAFYAVCHEMRRREEASGDKLSAEELIYEGVSRWFRDAAPDS